jgi:hypothetical protein
MDNNVNEYGQYFSLANRNGELYSNTPGDFINSEDLYQYLPRVIEVINKANGPGMNPFPAGIPPLPGSSLPSMPQPMDIQNKIPEAISQSNKPGVRMPEKEVLMEPCTVSMPLNAFLRKAYSKGSFYFLNKKIHDFGT